VAAAEGSWGGRRRSVGRASAAAAEGAADRRAERRRRHLSKLGDDAKVLGRLEEVEHLHDVLVAHSLEDVNLPAQRQQVGIVPPRLRDELERDDLPALESPALVHLAEGPLAHQLQHLIPLHRAAALQPLRCVGGNF